MLYMESFPSTQLTQKVDVMFDYCFVLKSIALVWAYISRFTTHSLARTFPLLYKANLYHEDHGLLERPAHFRGLRV